MSIADVLATTPVPSAEDALDRLDKLKSALPHSDGVAWFNRLYCNVSERVLQACGSGVFDEPDFVRALDVVFANLYFAALRSPAQAPRAWRPLLEARDRDVAPLRFAVAGMNAHINRDLPVALDQTFKHFGVKMDDAPAQRRDYQRVNQILEAAEADTKAEILTGLLGSIEQGLGSADDLFAVWSIAAARQTAWENAQVLEALRALPSLASGYVTALDRTVGFAGRALLLGWSAANR